jgi:hypothetical protein
MKLFIMLCISILSLNAYAIDRMYDVSGVLDDGGVVEGSARSNISDDPEVSGLITDEEGDTYSYEGKWVGDGQISGETTDGDSVELRVK